MATVASSDQNLTSEEVVQDVAQDDTQEVEAEEQTDAQNGKDAGDAAYTDTTTTATVVESKAVLAGDAEADEHDIISMPAATMVNTDLLLVNRGRRVVIHTTNVNDMTHEVIQEVMRNQVCENISFQYINGTQESGMKGVISMIFYSSKQATEYVPFLQSIRSDLVVQQAPTTDVATSLVSQWKKELSSSNPTTESMLIVKNLDPASATIEKLAALFPEAEDIVIASQPDASNKGKLKGRKHGYLLYKSQSDAQAALESYTASSVELDGQPLIILQYKQPPNHVPDGYLSLTARKLVLRHIARFKGLLVRAQEDPLLEVKDTWTNGMKNSSELIDKDDAARDLLGLPKPTLNDFKDMTNLKDLTGKQTDLMLVKLNLADKPVVNEKDMGNRKRSLNNDPNQQQKKKGRGFNGNNRGGSAGRGYPGGHRGSRPSQPSQYGFSTGVRQNVGYSGGSGYQDNYNSGLSYGRAVGLGQGVRHMQSGPAYSTAYSTVQNARLLTSMRAAVRAALRGTRGRGGWM